MSEMSLSETGTNAAKPGARPSEAGSSLSAEDVSRALRGRPHRIIEVAESQWATWRFGRGPDLLFVHGWPLHAATFRALIPHLADRFTCHLVDLPGAGQTTTAPGARVGFSTHAEQLIQVVDRLGLERYGIVAHDSGGFFARQIAAEDARVTGLVLGNTEVPGHTPWQVALFLLASKMWGGTTVFKTVLRSRTLRRSAIGFGGTFGDLSLLEGDFHDWFVEPLLRSKEAFAGQMLLLRTFDAAALGRLAEIHGQIRAPTLLLWGTEDPFFPLSKAREMIKGLPGGATLHAFEGAKLFVHEEHPAEFARRAAAFLAQIG